MERRKVNLEVMLLTTTQPLKSQRRKLAVIITEDSTHNPKRTISLKIKGYHPIFKYYERRNYL